MCVWEKVFGPPAAGVISAGFPISSLRRLHPWPFPPLAEAGSGSTSAGESWLLTTFVDEDLRIARGDGGSVFVLSRVDDK